MNCINCKYKDFNIDIILGANPKCYYNCPSVGQRNLNKFIGGIKIE